MMSQYAIAMIYPLFLWWFSTGIVMYIVGLPKSSFRWSIGAAVLVFFAALYGLEVTRADATAAGAYLAFSYALLIWGTQEIAFLTGLVTGPSRENCPANCVGWRRFRLALRAILYHELALLVSGLAVVAVTWQGANQIGAWTFLVLWTMRLSSKLNLFLGVESLNKEFLPKHLAFIGSFFTKARMNGLFPISITVSTAAVVLLMAHAWRADTPAYEAIGFTLLGTLLALAVLEHWFMFLPLPVVALWSWGLRSRRVEAALPLSAPEHGPQPSARDRLEDRFRRAHFERREQSAPSPALESGRLNAVHTASARFP